MDYKMAVIGDWAPPNPSPRTFMASLLNEEFAWKPFSDLSAGNGSDKSLFAFEKQQMSMNTKEECSKDGFNFSSNLSLESSLFDSRKSSSRGGLAQRMARSGFNAPTINTARIKSANMASSSSEVRSPYLTIPPGLSPTTLLDSPVFLSNSMVQPSPTTGTLSFMCNSLCNSSNSVSISESDSAVPDKSKDGHPEDVASGGFAFKPPLNTSSSYLSSSDNKGSSSAIGRQQSLQSTVLSFQNHLILPAGVSESSERKESAVDSTICPRPTDSFIGDEHSPPLEDQPDGEEDTKGEFSSTAVATPAEDGYNWRKYGQKQVKGSEFPRSYYKCTHPNCPVKKKVERSHEGLITEIIYKGVHNHAKPLPNRRSGVPSSHPFNDAQMDGLEHPGSQPNFYGKPHLWTGNAVDTTSSALIATEFCNPSASLPTQEGSHFGSPEAIDVASSVSNEEQEEDQATHGTVSLGGDGEEDESESKRRKLDACPMEMNTGSRAVREPRVVVQTTSEVDILDDGYRWRKYGQKVVKGNPNPRSYYKCTSTGCTVRKHVERASHDLESVITTYEGKHNHDVPAARNSSHSGTGPSAAAAAASTTHRRPELTQDGRLMGFEGPASLTSFSFPARDQQLGLGSGFSFGMGQGLANRGIASLGPMGQVKMPVHSSFHSNMGQQVSNSGAGFMISEGEPKEEPASETGLTVPNGMAAYHQLLSRLPLGPQL